MILQNSQILLLQTLEAIPSAGDFGTRGTDYPIKRVLHQTMGYASLTCYNAGQASCKPNDWQQKRRTGSFLCQPIERTRPGYNAYDQAPSHLCIPALKQKLDIRIYGCHNPIRLVHRMTVWIWPLELEVVVQHDPRGDHTCLMCGEKAPRTGLVADAID